MRQCSKGHGSIKKNEAHLTGSSSQGIMGITWAQKGFGGASDARSRAEGCGQFGPGNLA